MSLGRLANYVIIIAFELAVFVLTTAKTIKLTRYFSKGHSQSSLAELLLRDGESNSPKNILKSY